MELKWDDRRVPRGVSKVAVEPSKWSHLLSAARLEAHPRQYEIL
jgi:hypothetical protein